MAEQPKVSDLLRENIAAKKVAWSFEFFPPRTDKGDENLLAAMPEYKKRNPVFIDFTWGAGGTTSEKTTVLCKKCKEQGMIVNMHLTCTNMPEGKVAEALTFCKENGIRNIVALRGDPPAGQEWQASKDGFECALDLVKYIKANYGDYFSIAVAGYPEGHPDRINKETGACSEEDMEKEYAYLKAKVDAGGDYIITQLFYKNANFLSFVAKCRERGITVPILPGMLPILAYGGFQRMIGLCKTDVPADVTERMEALKEDDAGVKAYGVELTTKMCAELLEAGVPHLHFYTLNQSASSFKILENLGLWKEDTA